MSKQDLVESIQKLNLSASDEFLGAFTEEELIAYLHQLQEVVRPSPPQERPVLALAG